MKRLSKLEGLLYLLDNLASRRIKLDTDLSPYPVMGAYLRTSFHIAKFRLSEEGLDDFESKLYKTHYSHVSDNGKYPKVVVFKYFVDKGVIENTIAKRFLVIKLNHKDNTVHVFYRIVQKLL